MPGKLKVKIIAGRNLPVMDRGSDTTDAFVEIKLGTTSYKTDVCRKSLNPQWNSEWYKFEMEDSELQDEPLQIRLMDYDTYSANDAIGKVYLNLNPLLLPSCLTVSHEHAPNTNSIKGVTINGWLPVYDTMHGIRGEVSIVVKLELFEDFNKFRQSSCGVQFFSCTGVPEGYQLHTVHGFVEELVYADDPEYQWIDKIRTPRSTNEARQTLFFKLNGEVKRKIGLKVLDLGANAVVGYKQCFDLEGECGVVVRALGSAATLELTANHEIHTDEQKKEVSPLCRRSSDSDISVVQRGNSLSISDKTARPPHLLTSSIPPPIRQLDTLDMGEYPFLTITKYPPGFVQHIGGVVSARGVKLLVSDYEGTETRDSWWTELRLEVRSHARALSCNAVIAYSEQTTVCEDVCILSAGGTAAIISQKEYNAPSNQSVESNVFPHSGIGQNDTCDNGCKIYHVPYNEISHPFRMKLVKCAQCRKGKVGEVLMTTADLPPDVSVKSTKGSLVDAVVCRHKRDCKGELNAKEVSDALPFLEYELHTQLIHKLSAIGANAIVGLKVELALGERVLVGHATGTGIALSALPIPQSPADNKYDMNCSDDDDWEEQVRELDLSSGNKDTCLLEVGEGSVSGLGTSPSGIPPEGFLISTTQDVPGAPVANLTVVRNLQMFTQIWKARMCPLPSSSAISNQFHRILQGVYFKLRGMTPCALANVSFKIELPQQDDLQISVVGMAVGLAESDKRISQQNNNDDVFKMDKVEEESSSKSTPIFRPARKSIHTPPREQRYGVDVTPLCYVPGAKIVSYLGNLNFFFIRESSCIRETGGLSSFVHGFVAEVLAIVRAHVTAIGGNALTSYTMSRCHLTNNTHKNQAQCLLNVGGDAVYVSYAES